MFHVVVVCAFRFVLCVHGFCFFVGRIDMFSFFDVSIHYDGVCVYGCVYVEDIKIWFFFVLIHSNASHNIICNHNKFKLNVCNEKENVATERGREDFKCLTDKGNKKSERNKRKRKCWKMVWKHKAKKSVRMHIKN